jgi:F-type H+-transporting ATPase subunit delta
MMERQLASRYAEALFSLSRENNFIDPVAADLEMVADLLARMPDFARMLEHPEVARVRKYRLLEKTVAPAIQPLSFAFLKLLVRRQRTSILSLVAEEYVRFAEAAKNMITVAVESAVAMTPGETMRLQQALQQLTGKHITLQVQIAPALLAGLRVRIADTMLDGSAAGRLEALRGILHKTGGIG